MLALRAPRDDFTDQHDFRFKLISVNRLSIVLTDLRVVLLKRQMRIKECWF